MFCRLFFIGLAIKPVGLYSGRVFVDAVGLFKFDIYDCFSDQSVDCIPWHGIV